ncbi:MAG: DEAD/DEAH box helicase [Acetobacteraceae bacterium]|nr:DEAD/DEAH box helicase [Acetobacteraceae bacterium]
MGRLFSWGRLEPIWQRAGVVVYPHQIQAAIRVVEEMGGRGILADEVGLGKTVEAGLVAFELLYRGLVRRILVLCPAALVTQWQAEMAEKFDLSFVANPRGAAWLDAERIVASIDFARRPENARLLRLVRFDLLVVDEAHKLKNSRSQNHRLVQGLPHRYLLLLTATPVQNHLGELFSLVSLVNPALFGSLAEFRRRFLIDRRTPRNPRDLRQALSQVMVRRRRPEVATCFPERRVSTLGLELLPPERELYDLVTRLVRQEYRRRLQARSTILPLLTLQREVCSSSFAVGRTLSRLGSERPDDRLRHLAGLAQSVSDNAKARALEGLIPALGEPAIVFTEFRATQAFLARRLRRLGLKVVCYHGALGPEERARALEAFKSSPAAVLVSTECGGQGMNLQFCRNVINYDLSWNPMRVEQRIGRVHRLGQLQDVNIFNLYARGTVEEHLLHLLYEKIDLFRQVVGDLDVILRRLDRAGAPERSRGIESRILEICASGDDEEMRRGFERLGEELLEAKRRVQSAALEVAGQASTT